MSSQRTLCMALVISSHIFVLSAGEVLKACNGQTCLTDAAEPSAGSQLLQVSRSNAHTNVNPGVLQAQPLAASIKKTSVECSEANMGKTIPLHEQGFTDVSESCCYDDMREFLRRMIAEIGLKVCHEGGLSGFAPYFSCTNDATYGQAQSELMEQAREGTRCRWVQKADEECQPIGEGCGVELPKESLLKGYMGLDAENNPPALVTNSEIKEQIKKDVADKLAVPESAVVIEVGTGPVGSASLYQVAMKSPTTGKYVEIGSNGDLVASSENFKTLPVRHEEGDFFSVKGGSKDVLVKWNKDSSSFQTQAGEHAMEDDSGRVVFGKNPDRLLQVSFPGSSSLVSTSLGNLTENVGFLALQRRSCTVMVSFEVLQTEPPSLEAKIIQDNAEQLDVAALQSILSEDIDKIESCLGKLEISTFKFCKVKGSCKNKSLRLAHSDRDYNHQGNHVKSD